MPFSLAELLDANDPAWPLVEQWIASAKNQVEVLPARDDDRSRALEELQVTTRSPMGAIVYETGGLLIDHGWLRILGSGHPRLPRSLMQWNREAEADGFLLIADDVVGGFFAINGGALGKDLKTIYYFAPDTLRWESLELGYSDFLCFALGGDVQKFYENLRWPSWRDEIAGLDGSRVLSIHPPPWTAEGKNIAAAIRTPMAVAEAFRFNVRFMAEKLKSVPEGARVRLEPN